MIEVYELNGISISVYLSMSLRLGRAQDGKCIFGCSQLSNTKRLRRLRKLSKKLAPLIDFRKTETPKIHGSLLL